ncbi:MAG: alanine dehydrogenase [Sphingobacteriales bacterium]|nr:alanine dehydrogenase [Sphingobacteriales bacterium]MBP9140623.1 alanine dehydrogenase [Chitinophagales bacterium]MDA0199214.1 alanine dehydrogenase [Bacteroidota bacterium]MBK6888637.1 alanine dehydrogenase [Sphingobacteriales bacterium]MBK7528853.1 alanine dehydrogenase [Sphingobacteriales bacterium]
MFKIGLISEGKIPPDTRVAFTPKQCQMARQRHPVEFFAQPSAVRCYTDQELAQANITITKDLSHCDLLIGVKEVPIEQLIPNKTYCFFSHTTKKQAYNQKLLQAIIQKNITLIDYECMRYTDTHKRIIGFGRFAGIVGAHNGILTYIRKFKLPINLLPAHQCHNYNELLAIYQKIQLPNSMRIVVTGEGRVAKGAIEFLNGIKLPQISPEAYLSGKFDATQPVFTHLSLPYLYVRIDDEGKTKPFDRDDFFENPHLYKSLFSAYTTNTDVLINGIYWNEKIQRHFSLTDMASPQFSIKVISDISCDMNGSVPATSHATTISNPVYGYDPITQTETQPYLPHTIDIMAVDNLPNELPRDASEVFGQLLLDYVLPEFLKPKSDMLEAAAIAKNGQLGSHFGYLADYVAGR